MNVKCCHIVLVIWIIALAACGYAESFPDRPTAAEMAEIVELGTACVLGVNERCLATQYQTNPVAYRVAPFTNTTGFYLDQSLMAAMASKIRSLVPYYVDPNTIYDGTTNIVMLTTNGLWSTLQIGDKTNQFTCTPAIGTNPATYGDNPWRIYVTNLQERYKVLNALKVTGASLSFQDYQYRWVNTTSYYDAAMAWGSTSWVNGTVQGAVLGGYIDFLREGPWDIVKQRGKIKFDGNTTVPLDRFEAWALVYQRGDEPRYTNTVNYFLDFEAPASNGEHTNIFTTSASSFSSDYVGASSDTVIPNPGYGEGYGWTASWGMNNCTLLGYWQFNYCVNEP